MEDVDKPDKLRFSVGSGCGLVEDEWKSCVMVKICHERIGGWAGEKVVLS